MLQKSKKLMLSAFTVVLVLLLGYCIPLWGVSLEFVRRQFLSGYWWELFSSQLTHFNYRHALINILAAVVILIVADQIDALKALAWASVGGLLGVAVVLCFDTQIQRYSGASGFLHGSFAGLMMALIVKKKNFEMQLFGVVGLVLVGAKTWMEQSNPNSYQTWLGIFVYENAHLAGAIGGSAAVVIMKWVELKTKNRHSHQ